MKKRKGKVGKIIIVILIVMVAIVAIYFTFFYSEKCRDMGCFQTALARCKRVRVLNDAEDATWFYKIIGKRKENCKVRVDLVKVKAGHVDMIPLEGKSMNCYLPFGSVTLPQENLARCHGLLKEEMQALIINRLHSYIVENLGEISEEIERPL